MKNTKQNITLISKKIDLDGLTNNELKLLGIWYNAEKCKSSNTSFLDKLKGTIIFEKMLAKTNLFTKKTKIEIVENQKWGFSFKCKDKNGNDTLIYFLLGGGFDHCSKLRIVNKDFIKTYYIGFPSNGYRYIPCLDKYPEEKLENNINVLKKYNSVFNIKSNEIIDITQNKPSIENKENKNIESKEQNNLLENNFYSYDYQSNIEEEIIEENHKFRR